MLVDLVTQELRAAVFASDYNSSLARREKVPVGFIDALFRYLEKLEKDAAEARPTDQVSATQKPNRPKKGARKKSANKRYYEVNGDVQTEVFPEQQPDAQELTSSEPEDDEALVDEARVDEARVDVKGLDDDSGQEADNPDAPCLSPGSPAGDETAAEADTSLTLAVYEPKAESAPRPLKPNSIVPQNTLPAVSSASTKWDEALAHDVAAREVIKRHMRRAQSYTDEEKFVLENCSELKSLFRFKGLMTPVNFDQHVRAMGICQAFKGSANQGDVFGSVEGTVFASCENVAWYSFDNEAHYHKAIKEQVAWTDKDQTLARENVRRTIAKPNEHCRIVFRRKPAPSGGIIDGREFLNAVIWKRVSATEIVLVFHPTEHEAAPRTSDFVRAENFQHVTFKEIRPGVTHIHTFFHANLNGAVPAMFTLDVAPRYSITGVKACMTYFQHLVPLDEMTELHGRDLGDLVMDRVLTLQEKTNWKRRVAVVAEEVDEFFAYNAALRQVFGEHPCIKAMVKAVIEQRVVAPGVVKTKLANLTAQEAMRIGSFLKGEITIGVNSYAAVDNWIASQIALVELDEKYDWFRSFMYAVALRIIKSSDLGMKARVVFGSGLSIFDMASDIYMIDQFMKEGETFFAYATLAMIAANMVFQLFIVYASTAKMKASTRAMEVLFVLTCVKPGVDGYRIAVDWQTEEEQVLEPLHEMVLSKGCETGTEALPASVLQVFALINAKKRSKAALASVAISILTTSFTMTMVSFDYDMSPKKRVLSPEIYGFIRSDARTKTFALIFVFTALHVANQVFMCGLVSSVNSSLLYSVLVGHVALMVFVKFLRGDLTYASVRISPAGMILSVTQRGVANLLVNFAVFIQARHPYEMGGAYWVFIMVLSQVFVWSAPAYYISMSANLEVKLDSDTVWTIVGVTSLLWLIFFVWLVMTIDEKYLPTFFQTKTAREYTINVFRNADTDEKKALIFKRQFHVWRSIEGEVRTWVHANLGRWEKEKPEWYTKKLIQKIPEEVLTKEEMAVLVSGGKRVRRKSSIFEEVGLVNAD
jgi:hypothetical protein